MKRKYQLTISILAALCLLLVGLSAIAQEGQIVRETVHSPSLEGNLLGDSPDRAVTIYLPPSYEAEPDRYYPVVYLLHGYTGNNELWTGGSYISGDIRLNMKNWLNAGRVKEMVLVMPSSYNKFRGSQYANSVATGNWADFIVEDLVEYIDNHYRTLSQRESRALIGHSMGGRGAIELGMLYPKVFGYMGGMAGAYMTEEALLLDSSAQSSWAFASTIENWIQFYSLGWLDQASFAVAAAWAPNPSRPPFYCDFPFVYTDTEPRKIVKVQEVYDKFLEHDNLRMTEEHLAALLDMKAIYIDCGTNDQAVSIEDSRKLHENLNSLGVGHVYKEFAGDHTCCVMTSTGDALELFSKAMAFEMLPKVSVQPRGMLATTWGEMKQK